MPQTYNGITLYHKLSRFINNKEVLDRKKLLTRLNKNVQNTIAEKNGYAVFQFPDRQLIFEAIKHTEKITKKPNIENINKYQTLEHIDVNDVKNDIIVNLAAHESILYPVSTYLNTFPILWGVSVWYMPASSKNYEGSSQQFHFDREDVKQIKCFIPLDDLTYESGPTCILPFNKTKYVYKKLCSKKYSKSLKNRFADEDIYKYIDERDVIPLLANKGSFILLDTTNCLHCGGRDPNRERRMLVLHYFSAFSPKLPLVCRKRNTNRIFLSDEYKKYLFMYINLNKKMKLIYLKRNTKLYER